MKISLSLVAIDKMSRVIGDAVKKSNTQFDAMQKKIKATSEKLDKLGKDFVKVGGVIAASGIGAAHALGLTGAIPETIGLEHHLRKIGNLGKLTDEQLNTINKRLGEVSKTSNKMRNEIYEAMWVLVDQGVDPMQALDYLNVISKTATAQVAEITSVANTAFAVTENLKVPVGELQKTMDMLVYSGQEGRIGLKDMAEVFPILTQSAMLLGMRGSDAVAQLSSAMQIAIKGTKDQMQASMALNVFLQRLTAPSTVKRFADYGVNIKKVINDAIAQGKDPIYEVLAITKKVTKGDLFQVSEIFSSPQVLKFIKPMIQNLEEYKKLRNDSMSAEGIVDNNYANMLKTTTEQWKKLQITMKELFIPNLEKPLSVINKVLTTINNNPILQKGLFTLIMGTTAIGTFLTVAGGGFIIASKLVKGYGDFLGVVRNMTPVLKSGMFTGFLGDVQKLDSRMKAGIVDKFGLLKNHFLGLPSNIAKSAVALKDWTVTSVKAFPANFMTGLNSLKMGFLGIPSAIKKAIIAFRAFSLTLLTSPLGWIALAIAGVALLIFKFWKPITGFFRGVWQGLREGLAPLKPAFDQLVTALQPVIAPIKAVFDWFKKLFKPVEDVGGAAENMGIKFGRALADIILKFTELIKKVFDFGAKIGDMLSNGILSKLGKTREAIGKHAQIIRDHLPHSPAKTGPLKDLNKLKISETIAANIKPFPIVAAMQNTLKSITAPLKGNVARGNFGSNSSSGVVIHYSPTITITGSENKEEFRKMLKQHKDEVVSIFRRETERLERVAY